MTQWTIAKRLVVGFGVVVSVSFAPGVFTALRLSAIDKVATSIKEDAVPGMAIFGEIASLARDGETLSLRMALGRDSQWTAETDEELAAVADAADTMLRDYEKTIFAAQDRALFEVVKREAEGMRSVSRQFLEYARSHSAKESGLEFDRQMKPALESYLNAIQAEVEFNKKSAFKNADRLSSMVSTTNFFMIVGLVLALVLSADVYHYIVQSPDAVLSESIAPRTRFGVVAGQGNPVPRPAPPSRDLAWLIQGDFALARRQRQGQPMR